MKNRIEFYSPSEEQYESAPHPAPASKFIPQWFKNLETDIGGPSQASTIKRCIPFLDSLTSGYIIPLWHDIHFKTYIDKEHGPSTEYSWPQSLNSCPSIENHSADQIKGSEISQTTFGKFPLKFMNPWHIKTPPGYSCLFVQPLNHQNDNFQLISGIVDTDTYTNRINFPFVWLKNDFDDVLPKGMPLVQVIPFKREEWNSNIKVSSQRDNKDFNSVATRLNSVFKQGYKSLFWHKKSFK